ncbi:hypothetical protein [Mesorhizobium sp. M6A.T.Cr.TU.016.01.1.1]|uniref:hypothetical protein n=1 Tax=Mesorhizobium sp. M6A.T.Cr.TU.016.01.1.1 TaxID=2493677 RepID=UPI000F74CFA8|nr:hypothetical protein [Mesorhizobium sp. M6A.T.Cr.TU.016.01.1.1]AZO67643.1 hypothetical protein EJ075_23800 [Mesorhizobium sp. M6A.T.Cr.TU.016.01.1.1]
MNRSENLLTSLAEECTEVGQRVSKALRFGLAEVQPGQPLTNAERISQELTDLIAVMRMATNEGLIPKPDLSGAAIAAKQAKVEKFMAYARECGALE